MRTVDVDEWMRCSLEQRALMEAWFEDHGMDWGPGVLILERRCGVSLLRACRDPIIRSDGELVALCPRPVTQYSESPFPWP